MNDFYQNILNRLRQANNKRNLIDALNGVLKFVIVFALAFFIVVLIESIFFFESTLRTIFFFLFIAAASIFFLIKVIFPLIKNIKAFSNFDLNGIANYVGGKYPDIKDDLLNAVQLINYKQHNYSNDLIQAAFQKVYQKTENLDFSNTVKFNKWKDVRISSSALAAVIIMLFFIPFLNTAFERVINYDKEYTVPPKYVLTLQPGNIDVTRGESITVKITTGKDIPNSVNLFTRTKEETKFNEINLSPDSNNIFTHTLKSLNTSLEYYASAEDVESEVYQINVIDRPIVKKMEMKITPPSYTKLPSIIQADNGSASVLPGTRLEYKITSSKNLKSAELVTLPGKVISLNTDGFEAEGNFYIKEKLNYYIKLTDTSEVKSENPIRYTINILEDEYPQVEIIQPGDNVELGLETILPLVIEIEDDYGFTDLYLFYRKNVQGQLVAIEFNSIPISISKNEKKQEIFYSWDITPFNLKAEEIVSYYVEVSDNDNINGPKKTKSKVYTLRIPSLDELFANTDKKQNEAQSDLTKVFEEAKKLSDELQKISDELKKDDRQITWEEKEKIEQALKKFENLESQVDDIKKQLDDVRKDLADNNLLSEETLQKYLELQDLMDQLSSEEMKKAFERMREQLENMMRNQVQNELENIQFNEEMFKKSLERTVNLLKRIQIEQKMDELIKRTENLSEQLSELNQQTEQSDLSNQQEKEALADKQNSLSEQMENLEKQMDELNEKMKEFDDMPQQDAEKLSEEIQQQKNPELNEQTSRQLRQNRKETAMQNQQQMMQNMQANLENMQMMQQNMQMQNQMRVMSDMMKALDDILTLSKDEEELKNKTREQAGSSSSLREFAQEQNQIRNNLDKITRRLGELSQKTFGITPEMGRAIGEARREMNKSIMDMQENNSGRAAQSQEKAMKSLNETAMMMKNSLEMMMEGQGQGGGMMSMMQQLQQMSQQQMSLNQMTQMMQQGQLSQEQMAQMQRLAQEQQMIQKSLTQLNEEAKSTGQSKRISSNLEQILKEMEEVVTGMKSNNIDDGLLQKQERILSKLLDAQRSINERDYEKERESFAGKNFQRETPPELLLSTDEGLQKLRDELLNASKEGYKKDYEELIRKYFEALQKEQTQN